MMLIEEKSGMRFGFDQQKFIRHAGLYLGVGKNSESDGLETRHLDQSCEFNKLFNLH